MITELTKEKASQLDELFKSLLSYKPSERDMGKVQLYEVIKSIPSLSGKDKDYISSLMYIVRQIQRDVPTLFFGTTHLLLQRESINDFLRVGGFSAIYERQRIEKRKERINLKLILVAAVTGIVSVLFTILQYFKEDVKPTYIQLQSQKQSTPLKDTTKEAPPPGDHTNKKTDVYKNDTTTNTP